MGGNSNTITQTSNPLTQKWHTTKEQKTGGFIGVETGLGIASSGALLSEHKAYVVAPINAIGGYQFYFFDKPYFHLGFRFRVNLGYTNYSASVNSNGILITKNIHNIQLGTEAQFLWDFLNKGNHTLGVHFSTGGFEVGTHFVSTTTSGMGVYSTTKADAVTDFVLMLSTGIHWYVKVNHQFFATYKHRLPLVTIYYDGKPPTYSNSPSYAPYALVSMRHNFMVGYSYKF